MTAALTEPQARALRRLAEAPQWASPAEVGEAMYIGPRRRRSSQGLGRTGGAMCARLIALGLAANASSLRGGFPAYSITAKGLAALYEHEAAPIESESPAKSPASETANERTA